MVYSRISPRIRPLGDCPDRAATLAEWFSAEWGEEYPEDRYEPALERLKNHTGLDSVPFTVVGFLSSVPVATAAVLRRMPSLERGFGPWLGWVHFEDLDRNEVVMIKEGLLAGRELHPRTTARK